MLATVVLPVLSTAWTELATTSSLNVAVGFVAGATPVAALAYGTTYTVTVSGARDAAGNALAAAYSWSFTTAAAPAGLFSATDTPPTASTTTTTGVEVGMKLRSSQNGWITAVRFYKGTGGTGTHVGSVWTAAGQRLAAVSFTNEMATGWQVAQLSQPVAVTAGTTYVASYLAPNGHYSATSAGLLGAAVDNPPLHALASSTSANGVYA